MRITAQSIVLNGSWIYANISKYSFLNFSNQIISRDRCSCIRHKFLSELLKFVQFCPYIVWSLGWWNKILRLITLVIRTSDISHQIKLFRCDIGVSLMSNHCRLQTKLLYRTHFLSQFIMLFKEVLFSWRCSNWQHSFTLSLWVKIYVVPFSLTSKPW